MKRDGVNYSYELRDIIQDLITYNPMTKHEIAEASDRAFDTVSYVMKRLRKKVHIFTWRRSLSGPPAAVWIWGEGEDAPRPKPLTSKEKSQRWRDENGAGYSKARYARRKACKHGLKGIDPLMAAIMGM